MALHYSANIVTNGLVLALDASDPKSYPGSGTTWFDRSGLSNNGTLVNGVGYNSSNRGSLVFDGVNDYVSCSGSIVTSQATFIVWVRRNGNQPTATGLLMSRGTNVTGLNLSYNNNVNVQTIGYTWNDAPNTYNWNSGLLIPNNAWAMCVISVAPTVATAYLGTSNGVSSAANNVSHSNTTINTIRVGRDDQGGRLFNGNIAVAQIYNRALSSSEIAQNFNATRGRFDI